jgi:hypothetical protein
VWCHVHFPKGNDVSSTELDIVDMGIPSKDLATTSYSSLLADGNLAYEMESSGLISKEALIGVPLVITGITFQHVEALTAAQVKKGAVQPRGFVSMDAIVGDVPALTRAIKRGGVPNVSELKELPVDPEERIVFNDGGTGIRRQLVGILDAAGIIEVGNGEPDKDRRFDRRFDLPWFMWDRKPGADNMVELGDNTVPYITKNHVGTQLLIPVRRGLHASHYTDDVYGEATTYYLG